MTDIVEKLKAIAEDGDISVSGSNTVAFAAAEIVRLRNSLERAIAALSSDPATPSPAEAEALPAGVDAVAEFLKTRDEAIFTGDDLDTDEDERRSSAEAILELLGLPVSASAPAPEER